MPGRPDDHGIEHEPHLRPREHANDPSEVIAEGVLRREEASSDREWEDAQHSVYDEPAFRAGAEPPLAAPGYGSWLAKKTQAAAAHPERAWRLAFLIMLAGGPWAVLGAIISGGGGAFAAIVSGPVAEEIMKIAILATLLEIRPDFLTRRSQIHLAAAGSALGFAIIENLLYLNVYIKSPTEMITLWRWTVCVVLHVGCSLIASLGVARVWAESLSRLERPRLGRMLPFLVTAIVVHGTYNGAMTILALTGFDF
jgi:hypothetical protein